MAWTTPTTFTAGSVLTATQLNTNVRDNTLALGRGYIAMSTLATTFSTASTTAVDVTGFSVTFTAEDSRRYLITLLYNSDNNGANFNQVYIVSGAAALAEGYTNPTASRLSTASIFAVATPSAGSVTYKVQMSANAGTGTIYGISTRTSLASRLLVTDIGSTV